jgi:uncharacterized protein
VILLDVNVLVYAHREDVIDHDRYHAWLQSVLADPYPFGVSDLVLSGFLRVVTHPRVFKEPTPLSRAIEFVNAIREQPGCVLMSPGERHWELFTSLCVANDARGNQIPDAYHAALAIETGSDWITTDRGFGRYKGLRWRHPFDS